jgi:hypothetical protein
VSEAARLSAPSMVFHCWEENQGNAYPRKKPMILKGFSIRVNCYKLLLNASIDD